AGNGENYGFVVLRNGALTRRIPYFFLVDRPALAAAREQPLRTVQSGTTASGESLVGRYRYPASPFGNQPDEPPMIEDGHETVYVTKLPKKEVNVGVAVWAKGDGARIDPWYLGGKDENSVPGYAGTPG